MGSSLDVVPIPVLFVLTILLGQASIEIGRWVGHRRGEKENQGPVGASVGATLGLLAFILAFTFGMAASRFDARREMVLEDANAIGTTYLRAQLLSEPTSSEIRSMLREYVDVRLNAAASPQGAKGAVERSEQLQNQMWAATVALVARQQGNLGAAGPFINSLNELIDVHAKRVAAVRNRIPNAIWFFLFLTAAIGMMSMGYQAGLTESRRRSIAVATLAVAFSAVMMLIVQLDRPQGFLRVSQEPMADLQRSMQADVKNMRPPAPSP
ncbi:MAG TPA: hypothetical protein VKB41_09895 [Steroidobacteraceae bacterium]|nr:hypothetical protein [Steroidobacteraceae bacterium]